MSRSGELPACQPLQEEEPHASGISLRWRLCSKEGAVRMLFCHAPWNGLGPREWNCLWWVGRSAITTLPTHPFDFVAQLPLRTWKQGLEQC